MFLVQSGSMETQFIQILLDVSDPRYTVEVSDHKKAPRCTENSTYFLLRATSCGHGWGILICIKAYFHTENLGRFSPEKDSRNCSKTQMFSRRFVEHKKCSVEICWEKTFQKCFELIHFLRQVSFDLRANCLKAWVISLHWPTREIV